MGSNIPAVGDQSVFPGNSPVGDDRFTARSETPTSRPKRAVENPSVFYFWKIEDAVYMLHLLRVN